MGFTGPSSLALCCPLCTLKRLLFRFFCLLWELRFKSLTNVFVCWTVETTRLSADVARSWAVTQFLRSSVGLDSNSSQVRGTKDSGR